MAKVDTTALDALSGKIKELPVRTTVTPYEVVKFLAPTIHEALARGQDLSAIAKLLAAIGVRLAPATIGNYLRRVRRESSSKPPTIQKPPAAINPDVSTSASALPAADAPLERARKLGPTADVQSGRFELVQDKDV